MLTVQELPVESIRRSPHNPRTFREKDPGLDSLAESIKAQGLIQPITVRPIEEAGKGSTVLFELVAGERRWRASKLAGLEVVPALVRTDLTDEQALELIVTENLQREDLNPLEEAKGYQQLLQLPGHDVAQVAARMARSVKYVYDRVKLLSLTEPAQQLLWSGEITAGHAILLARLTPSEQERALEDGLFTRQQLVLTPEQEEKLDEKEERLDRRGDYGTEIPERRKAVSVRELQGWIDEHVHFDHQVTDPILYPITVERLEEAEKVVQITYAHHVDPAAKDGSRIYGPRSWKRADGGTHKMCEDSVTGVIVAGPGRGEAFKVCLAKKKCKVHWAQEQREAAQRAKADAKSGASGRDRYAEQEARAKAEREREQLAGERWEKALPAILKAVAEKVKKASTGTTGALAQLLLQQIARPGVDGKGGKAAEYVALGKSAEDLIRHLAFAVLKNQATWWRASAEFPKMAKAFGVDTAAIVAAATPPAAVQTSAAEKPAAAKKSAPKKKSAKRRAA